ncbi:hypothetical protein GXW82_44645 [Streptacidiphilus sp. 4-A2]|nr:hypothetical protein [Streptacidiphilus sp. 4-A2]
MELPPGSRRTRRFCSARCRTRCWRELRARRAQIESGGEALRAVVEGRPHPWPRHHCPECGARWHYGDAPAWNHKRADAAYCSPRCRTRAWRKRRTVQQASPGDASE